MGEEIKLQVSIDELLNYWQKQNIVSGGVSAEEIHKAEKRLGTKLPDDFIQLYARANGMESLYPNYTDQEGFLFYPVQELITFNREFRNQNKNAALDERSCIIFMNYMQRSWYYGILMDHEQPNEYKVIIIPDADRYKVICTSLSEFISLYTSNSEVLYEY